MIPTMHLFYLPHLCGSLESVFPRHVDIEKYQVWGERQELFNSINTINSFCEVSSLDTASAITIGDVPKTYCFL